MLKVKFRNQLNGFDLPMKSGCHLIIILFSLSKILFTSQPTFALHPNTSFSSALLSRCCNTSHSYHEFVFHEKASQLFVLTALHPIAIIAQLVLMYVQSNILHAEFS